jgi:penicillin-binding protein 1C
MVMQLLQPSAPVDMRALFFFVFLLVFFLLLFCIPLPTALTQQPRASILLAADGSLLDARIASDHQWRFDFLNKLPEKYELAVLTYEDQYFYSHVGINPVSIIRAAKNNINAGKITSGGSTITMQLARLLKQKTQQTNRNYLNKTREALLALRLEAQLSKKQILQYYTGLAPFGGNTVGLNAAAWRYFGRSPEYLSWAESALLAVLPNSPGLIHLGRHTDKLQQKRNRLLYKLHKKNYLNDLDLQLALLEPLPEKPKPLVQLAPQLLTRLERDYPNIHLFHSTIEPSMQRLLHQVAKQRSESLANQGVHNIAMVLIDHTTMKTLAYLGNHAWQQKNIYAPDVDILQSPRSTGSILKPLLYGLMLQEGSLTPQSLVPDIPTQIGGYSPSNYDRNYRGAVPAQSALAHSLNVPAVRMLRDFGVARFQQSLQAMNITSLFRPADDYGLTLILGGAEASLWEMTSIYAQLAATARDGDTAQQSVQLLQTKDHLLQTDDHSVIHNNKKKLPVIRQGAAWLTLDALIAVARPGQDNYWRDFAGSQTIAWKTGTSYGLRDAWAIGSSGRYTLGVWVGNAGGEAASFMSGQTSAAPLLFDVFDGLPKSNWIEKPEFALKKITVCKNDIQFQRMQHQNNAKQQKLIFRLKAILHRQRRITNLSILMRKGSLECTVIVKQ